MSKYLFFMGVVLLFLSSSCSLIKTNNITAKPENNKKLSDFLLKSYRISEKIYGDLNNDGLEDCIIITKATDKSKIITDKNKNKRKLDRNRRGIIILLNINNRYELAESNYNCFSSENEDGGAYYAPVLQVEVQDGDLLIHYEHGRYGYWEYKFRFQNSNFELIGFNQSDNSGPITNSEIKINYLSKTRILKENTNKNARESGEEVFNVSQDKINLDKLIKLSEIRYFDMIVASED